MPDSRQFISVRSVPPQGGNGKAHPVWVSADGLERLQGVCLDPEAPWGASGSGTGADGKSAYEVAVANGDDFRTDLHGDVPLRDGGGMVRDVSDGGAGMTALAPRVRVRRDGMPVAPVEIADEVELYAREHGRTAHLHFFPTLFVNGRVARGTWVVRLSLKPNDPEMLLYREGKRPEPPTEDVWIHSDNPRAGQTIPGTYGQREPPHLALDIHQMGASGVRQFLEKGNLDSGRGEFGHKTLEQIVRETREKDAAATARVREQAKQGAVDIAMDRRRSIFGIPFHRVGIDLKALAGKVARRSNPTGAATGRAKES